MQLVVSNMFYRSLLNFSFTSDIGNYLKKKMIYTGNFILKKVFEHYLFEQLIQLVNVINENL